MRRMPFAVACGGLAGLLVLWAAYPNPGRSDRPHPSSRSEAGVPVAPVRNRAEPLLAIPLPSIPPSATPADGPKSSPMAAPAPREGASPGSWDHLSFLSGVSSGSGQSLQEAVRATAVYLSVESGSLMAFEEAARRSAVEMQQALARREQDLATLGPGEVYPSVPSEACRRSEERYAAARLRALQRLEPYLDETPCHREFRWAFDSWAGMVSAKAWGNSR